MTNYEREMLIADCEDACRHNVPRTDEEATAVRRAGIEAARKLGYEYPEDVVARLRGV